MTRKRVPYLLVDAFTGDPGLGNRAGVVTDAAALTADDMQRVAEVLGVSETVFVTSADHDDHWVRYYTPTQEIEFCGHATIALAYALASHHRLERRAYLKTMVGSVPVDVELDSSGVACVWMHQPHPEYRPLPPRARHALAEALGIDARVTHRALPTGAASTGLWTACLPVIDAAILESLEPDHDAIGALSRAWNVSNVYVYAATSPTSFAARDFSPAIGIPEDPVTGSAAGALAALLGRHGALNNRGVDEIEMRVTQGHLLGTPGEVRVIVEYRSGGPHRVRVGGCAVTAYEGTLEI